MSALSKLEKLMYTIGVVDKATGPVNKIMDKINQLSAQTASAQNQMMSCFMGTAGGAIALVSSLSPAIDHVAALGEVQTLGVANEDLTKLTKTAFEFTTQFGGNSAEFVRSAYDIQSAISGLTGDELASFTKASNVLAVATKADASTITSYMGAMYGIFEKTANKMGKSDWVNQIAGQTAKAVQMYKTTGAEMESAFSSLGAKATNRGIDAAEQFAVLGELQLVLKSGSEAGTKYASFIDGIGKAQKKLGIELTNSQGDMLSMDIVLERINQRLAGVGSVARGDILNTAFGSTDAAGVVDILSTKTAKLKQGISELTSVTDASKASEMANIIATPWDRFSGSLNGAATAMGQAVLPIIEPVVDMLVAMLGGVIWLTQEFPTLTGVLGAAAVGVIGLMMAFSAMNMIIGIYRFALIGLSVVTNGAAISTKLWQMGLVALRVMGFLGNIAVMGAYLAVIGLYRGAMLAAQGVTWLFNTALLANPIGIVIAGVVALVAAVAGLIFYWDAIVAAFKDSSWGQGLIKIFDGVMLVFTALIDNVKWVLEALGLIDGKDMTMKAEVEEITKTAGPIPTELNANQLSNRDISHVTATLPVAANQAFNSETFAAKNLISTHSNASQINSAASVSESQAFNELTAHSARIQQYQENNHQLAKVSSPRIQRTQYFQQSKQHTNNNSNSNADNSKRVYIDNVVMKSDNLDHDFELLMELAG
ncbi:Prophage PSPPH06, tail tape measure protein, TP901 family [Moritella viscosa]|uniref:phage tail tape measure protein n=1 Tax=Moritella viscosa TaxID=80854 RepID=UPI00091452A6|nr:phage tail tape measure protein [Moritella viscosa]SHO28109.1 Prophage PSPPH06, tail tape measure protein, TP901 family [Moritella viscosa]